MLVVTGHVGCSKGASVVIGHVDWHWTVWLSLDTLVVARHSGCLWTCCLSDGYFGRQWTRWLQLDVLVVMTSWCRKSHRLPCDMLFVTGHGGCPAGHSVGTWVSVDQFIIKDILVVLADSVDEAIQVAVQLVLVAQSL